MAGEITSSIAKILIAEADVDSSVSEQLFTKIGATINGLIDQHEAYVASIEARLSAFGTMLKKVAGANNVDATGYMYNPDYNTAQMVVVSGVWKIKWILPPQSGSSGGGSYFVSSPYQTIEQTTGFAYTTGDIGVVNYNHSTVKFHWAVYRPTTL
jgi:hypothetical protein